MCVLVHHYQLLTEVERPPHREHVAVHHVITSNTPSLRLSRSKHTHEVDVHVATAGSEIPRNLVHEGIWFMGESCLRGGGGNKDCGSGVFQDVATLARATFGEVSRAALPSPSSPPRSAQQVVCFCS